MAYDVLSKPQQINQFCYLLQADMTLAHQHEPVYYETAPTPHFYPNSSIGSVLMQISASALMEFPEAQPQVLCMSEVRTSCYTY